MSFSPKGQYQCAQGGYEKLNGAQSYRKCPGGQCLEEMLGAAFEKGDPTRFGMLSAAINVELDI